MRPRDLSKTSPKEDEELLEQKRREEEEKERQREAEEIQRRNKNLPDGYKVGEEVYGDDYETSG